MSTYEEWLMSKFKEKKDDLQKQKSVTWFLIWCLFVSVSVNGMFCYVTFIK